MLYNDNPDKKYKQGTLSQTNRIPLTYIRMILWKHAAFELQRLFPHLKRLVVSSKVRVRVGETMHGIACTSHKMSRVQCNAPPAIHRIPLTYIRIIFL